MTTVYSRPQTTSNLTLEDHVHAPRVNESGFDLVDILKLAITNLKSKNQRPKKAKSAKFPVQFVIKTAILIRKQYSVHFVNTGFIETAMLHPNKNIAGYPMSQMIFLFNVCFASWKKMLTRFHFSFLTNMKY